MAAKESKLLLLVAAIALAAAPAAFASIPRSEILAPAIDRFAFENAPPARPETSGALPLVDQLRSAADAAWPLASLAETRIRAFNHLAPFEQQEPSELSRALHQAYAEFSPGSASDESFCGGDPVNCKDPTGEIGLRAALTDGFINEYEMSTLELTDEEIRTIIGSQGVLKLAGANDPGAAKDNLTRAKFILLARNPAFKAYAGQLYELTRGLNPVHFAAEVGWALGSGEEPVMQQKINRGDKALELATYLAFMKGGQWVAHRLSAIRANAVGSDGFEPVRVRMRDRLSPREKGVLSNVQGKQGEAWSEKAIRTSGQRFSRNVDLTFTIDGKRVTINADRLIHEADGSFVYVESKFSPTARYQPHQKIVIPELVRAGDQGLVATVGPRSGGTLISGQRVRVTFQGDVWNGGGGLYGH